MRKEFSAKERGSQRWLQVAVNRCPEIIDSAIASSLGFSPREEIEWRSPLESDGFAEYTDGEFLDRLDVHLEKRALKDFWPSNGPHWDGLARTSEGRILLVEAKANIPEFNSDPTGAGRHSLKRIRAAFAETREFLKVRKETDWSQCFYQYANRLAHLYLLRELNGLDASMVFVYFVNDPTNCNVAPVPEEGWEAAISLASEHLGIRQSNRWISENVADVFIDVSKMCHVPWP